MSPIGIGVGAVIAGILLGRVLMETAVRRLPPDRRDSLHDAFARLRVWQLLPLVVIVAAFVLLDRSAAVSREVMVWGFGGAFVVYTVAVQTLVERAVRRLELPRPFRMLYLAGRVVQTVGTGVFLAVLLLAERIG